MALAADEPNPGPDGFSGRPPVELTPRQQALLAGLNKDGPPPGLMHLPSIYLGLLEQVRDHSASDALAKAAHCARELMEKLSYWVNNQVPEERRERLGDKMGEIDELAAQARASLPPDRSSWDENTALTVELIALLDQIDEVRAWRENFTLEPGGYSALMVEYLLGPLPPAQLKAKRRQWARLRDFFNDVSHHRIHRPLGRAATIDDVAASVAELEEFLFARWAPRTLAHFEQIDRLLEEP